MPFFSAVLIGKFGGKEVEIGRGILSSCSTREKSFFSLKKIEKEKVKMKFGREWSEEIRKKLEKKK